MTLQHEIFVASDAQTYLAGTKHSNAHQHAAEIADAICSQKGWTRGLSCMVVMRDGRNGRTPYFVINQVLDTQTKVFSTPDICQHAIPQRRHALHHDSKRQRSQPLRWISPPSNISKNR